MTSDPNANIERNTVEARQGSTKPNLIYVLAGGLALVLVVFAIVWASTKH